MGSKPKPYKMSAEEIALQKSQIEELNTKKSELNEYKYKRMKGGAGNRSLVSYTDEPKKADETVNTLGV